MSKSKSPVTLSISRRDFLKITGASSFLLLSNTEVMAELLTNTSGKNNPFYIKFTHFFRSEDLLQVGFGLIQSEETDFLVVKLPQQHIREVLLSDEEFCSFKKEIYCNNSDR